MSDWSNSGWPTQPEGAQVPAPPMPTPAPDPQWGWVSQPPPMGAPISYPPPREQRPPHRRTIRSLLSVAGVLTVAAVILPIVGTTATADAAEVVSAAKLTEAQHTAHLELSGSVSADGQTIPISGSGSSDFTQPATSLTMDMSADGQSVSISEIFVGGTLYEQVPGISTIEPGKSWVSADIAAMEKSGSSSSPLSNADPAEMLALLQQKGYSVTSLGSSTVNGVDVTGYEVQITDANIKSQLQNLPSWLKQSASSMSFSGMKLDVYIDGANEIRRTSVNAQVTVSGHSASMDLNLDYSDYGDPVSVSAPPADQVVDLQQFLQDSGVSSGP
jgi:hypothetical protein